jgi:hypothetical protein
MAAMAVEVRAVIVETRRLRAAIWAVEGVAALPINQVEPQDRLVTVVALAAAAAVAGLRAQIPIQALAAMGAMAGLAARAAVAVRYLRLRPACGPEDPAVLAASVLAAAAAVAHTQSVQPHRLAVWGAAAESWQAVVVLAVRPPGTAVAAAAAAVQDWAVPCSFRTAGRSISARA